MSVQLVDFGRIDAESEDALSEYFVDIGTYGRIRKGERSYILGRKGSGKTAIFKTANKINVGHDVLKFDFQDYPWEIHKAICDDGVPGEAAFVSSWRFFFYVSICRHWGLQNIDNISAIAKNYLNQIYGSDNPDNWKHLLIDRLKRLRKIDLPSVEGAASLGGFELDEAQAGPLLAQSVSQWSSILGDFVRDNWRKYPVTLIVDRLDDGWDASEKSKQLLIGVLKATRDVNLNLIVGNRAVPVITLLRSDIYDTLQFNDKNKINADIEALDWTPESLVDVINARISRSLGGEKNLAWDLIFSPDEMRQRASIRSYLIKRTMLRPRDLVAFCIKCKEVAETHDHPIVQTSDVYIAEESYSKYMYDELDDEMHKQVPDSRQLMQVIRDIGSTRFTFTTWNQAIKDRLPNLSDEQSKDKLKVLFDYSVIGIPRSGGSGGGTKILYVYNDRFLEPDFRSEMAVHPSLKKPLKITEPRQS
jgi:energy-coupling factor transporter ATP-binding protein EcfA2